jgi:hypothetical protein
MMAAILTHPPPPPPHQKKPYLNYDRNIERQPESHSYSLTIGSAAVIYSNVAINFHFHHPKCVFIANQKQRGFEKL